MRTLAYWLSFIFVFTIPWETAFEDPALGSASRIAGLALAACWLVSVVTKARVRTPSCFHVVLGFFVILNFVSALWSASSETSVLQGVTWVQILLLSIILWDLYTSQSSVLVALQMYVFGSYVVVVSTIANYLAGQTYYYERFSAAGTNPDDVGIIVALGIPAAAYLAAFWLPNRLSFLKVVNSIYIFAAFIGIALTGTRTALIASIPGTIFSIALLTRLRRNVALGLASVFLVATLLLVPYIPSASLERLGTTGAEIEDSDLNGRLPLWREGFHSFQRNPLLGIGSNMFRSINPEGKVAHNSFVSVLVELGLLGLAVCAMVVITAAISLSNQPTWERGLWLSILVAWAIGASMLTWEYRKPTWLFLNLVVVSAAVLPTEQKGIPLWRGASDRQNSIA